MRYFDFSVFGTYLFFSFGFIWALSFSNGFLCFSVCRFQCLCMHILCVPCCTLIKVNWFLSFVSNQRVVWNAVATSTTRYIIKQKKRNENRYPFHLSFFFSHIIFKPKDEPTQKRIHTFGTQFKPFKIVRFTIGDSAIFTSIGKFFFLQIYSSWIEHKKIVCRLWWSSTRQTTNI